MSVDYVYLYEGSPLSLYLYQGMDIPVRSAPLSASLHTFESSSIVPNQPDSEMFETEISIIPPYGCGNCNQGGGRQVQPDQSTAEGTH